MSESSNRKACAIIFVIATCVILAVLGGTLIGTAPSMTFINPGNVQFIFGYTFMMILIVVIVNVVTHIITDIPAIFVWINVVDILVIIGATLIGISPSHAFVAGNAMFLTGFAFMMIVTIIAAVTAFYACYIGV